METKTYLGRYLITLDQYGQPIRLRRDGNATTYKAFDAQSSREVALEKVPAGTVKISAQSKLEAQAAAAKRLQQINIPALYEFGIEDNELIYAFEVVDGVSAEQWVTTHGSMPIGSALRIGSQVVNAIGAATFHGIFHSALNPSNIMIVPGQTAEGEWPLIKVLNFIGPPQNYSLGEVSGAAATAPVNFVAPEQLASGNADFASEIYSLGCTLWFLLTAAPPAAGAATVESANGVPAPVRRLISRMLAADPGERFADPVALHEQIEDCIAEVENKRVVIPPPKPAAVAPKPMAVAPVEPRLRRPFPWQPVALAAVLVLAGIVTAMMLPRLRSHETGEKIGVPVGVPEPVAAAAATSANPGPTNSSSPLATPGVLISTAGTDDETASEVAENAPTPRDEQATTQVAATTPANVVAPEPTVTATAAPEATSAAVVASNRPAPVSRATEPSPPSEGPAEDSSREAEPSTATTYADASPDGNQPTETAAEPAETPVRVARSETTPTPVREPRVEARPASTAVKRSASRERRTVSRTRERGGRVRAQFLGTTADGELIFGLPSDERGYLNTETPRERSRRLRRTTVRPAEPPDDLPVLPALPPDQ